MVIFAPDGAVWQMGFDVYAAGTEYRIESKI